MADTAAASIAQLAGAGRFQAIFGGHPGRAADRRSAVLHQRTAHRPRGFESEVSDTPPWPEDQKVVAEELGPYLAGIDE
jgi:hypothetical protein